MYVVAGSCRPTRAYLGLKSPKIFPTLTPSNFHLKRVSSCVGVKAQRQYKYKKGFFTGHNAAGGSGREVFQNPAGRVGSGQEVLEISWVEPDRV